MHRIIFKHPERNIYFKDLPQHFLQNNLIIAIDKLQRECWSLIVTKEEESTTWDYCWIPLFESNPRFILKYPTVEFALLNLPNTNCEVYTFIKNEEENQLLELLMTIYKPNKTK